MTTDPLILKEARVISRLHTARYFSLPEEQRLYIHGPLSNHAQQCLRCSKKSEDPRHGTLITAVFFKRRIQCGGEEAVTE